MSDKTPLERDLERNERFKVPLSMYILVILLLACVAAVGFYTFNLQQDLLKKDQDVALIKEKFRNEKDGLIERIKKLEKEAKEAAE